MFQRFSKFVRKNKVVKSGRVRFYLQFEALAANQSFKFPISKPKHYIYQKVSSKYTWWPESRSRIVPAPPPVVNKLQQTHQKQNPHIFSMQSWSWSGARSQEPCCIPDYIILTNISPKISETDPDKVYFCREKKNRQEGLQERWLEEQNISCKKLLTGKLPKNMSGFCTIMRRRTTSWDQPGEEAQLLSNAETQAGHKTTTWESCMSQKMVWWVAKENSFSLTHKRLQSSRKKKNPAADQRWTSSSARS